MHVQLFMGTHFVTDDLPKTDSINTRVLKVGIMNTRIYIHYWVLSIKIFSIIKFFVLSSTEKLHTFPINTVFYHLTNYKILWFLSQAWYVWFYFRLFCFEFIDFNTIDIEKTVGCIVVRNQVSLRFFLRSVNRLFTFFVNLVS